MSCPACFTGHENTATPKGRVETLHGRPTYIAEPKSGKPAKGLVIVVPDAFGWEFTNNRILADHYADAGDYKVYLPDFMDGTAAPVWMMHSMSSLFSNASIFTKIYNAILAIGGFVPFILRNRFGLAWPKINSFFKAVRENEGASLPTGAAGFCWGGPPIMKLAEGEKAPNGKPLVDACFTAHPSNLSIPGSIDKIVKPVSVGIGDKDFAMSMKQVDEMKKVWAGLQDKVDTEVKVYPGAGHGFGIRADPNDEKAVEHATEGEQQAIAWFQKHFAATSY